MNEHAGFTAAAWWIALSVIAGELFPPFKDLLASIFTHHWLAKGIVAAALFVIVGYTYQKRTMIGYPVEKCSWNSLVAAFIIIGGFYLIHFFL